MGLGAFGGGLGAVQYLASQGAVLTVTDLRDAAALHESLQALREWPDIQYKLGQHDRSDFTDTDLLVVNPAVAPGNEFVTLAQQAGVPLTTEMSLFWERLRGRVIAVTGSNGKSTTTALTHALVSQSVINTPRRCWLGGNIGKSLLPSVDQISSDDWVVLELSSFQLEWLDRIQARPDIAIVTNFSANHLDWHGSIEHYRHAKQTILRWQTSEDVAVLNADDPDVVAWPTNARRVMFGASIEQRPLCSSRVVGQELISTSDVGSNDASSSSCADEWNFDLGDLLKAPGAHNRMNAAAAIAAARAAGVSYEQIVGGLRSFEPLPHRLQFVAEHRGRRFYDDSIATTPESAICGLQSFDQPIVLLAGGYDKQVDLNAFGQVIAQRVKAVALMGQTADALAYAINSAPCETRSQPLQQYRATDFAEAFDWCEAQADSGDVVLLSPGCASYDWFRNYIDRGQQFAARVRSLR